MRASILLAVLCLAAPASAQAVITVTTTDNGDTRDGALSLREAFRVLAGQLAPASLTPAEQALVVGTVSASVQNAVRFAIPGAGSHVIDIVGSNFPAVAVPVSIDGTTQPGATCAAGPQGVTVEVRGRGSSATFTLTGGGHRVRGLAFAYGDYGVSLTGGTAPSEVSCNLFGYSARTLALAQTSVGDVLLSGGQGTRVGGTTAADRNVMARGVVMTAGTAGNTVTGNWIGTRPDGTSDPSYVGGVAFRYSRFGNTKRVQAGVVIYSDGGGNVVGGARPGGGAACTGPCNVVAAAANGMFVAFSSQPSSSPGNTILGNWVGLDADGVTRAPVGVGLRIVDGPDRVTVGGPSAGEGNRIENATAEGILAEVYSDPVRVVGNTIRGSGAAGIRNSEPTGTGLVGSANRLSGNGGLGIDIGALGVTSNDPLDIDAGRANTPTLAATPTRVSGGQAIVAGTLASLASTAFRVEAFANASCDASGYGEGETYLGGFDVTTDAAGNASFSQALTASGLDGQSLALTATGPEGTSEFSRCAAPPPPETYAVTTPADAGPGSLRQAILDANAHVGPDVIAFNLPGLGVRTIRLASELPSILGTTTIDGLTQPGASCASWPATLLVHLDGSGLDPSSGLSVNGLTVETGGGGSLIQGLVVNGFDASAWSGILIEEGADDNRVFCNYIGVTPDGSAAVPNGNGVRVRSSRNRIGGPEPGQRNLISANTGYNVEVSGFVTQEDPGDNVVQGNLLGTDVTGTRLMSFPPRGDSGLIFPLNSLHIETAVRTQVGGTDHDPWACNRACNLIAGGSEIAGISGGTVVEGNFIGTTLAGAAAATDNTDPRTFGLDGVGFSGRASDGLDGPPIRIGGAAPGAGNLISGNGDAGVDMIRSRDIVVQGNRIGTDRTGTRPIPNAFRGVSAYSVFGALIGGPNAGEGNVIAFNRQGGIVLEPRNVILTSSSFNFTPSRNVTISGNAIGDNNGEPGIDLMGDGVTGNDALDADPGSNGRLNAPRLDLSSVQTAGGSATVRGIYEGAPSATFRIEAFASAACGPDRFGPGERFLGAFDVTTGGDGRVPFDRTFAADGLPAGWVVTMTATDALGQTSEFSQCAAYPGGVLTVTTAASGGPGSLRDALLAANGLPDAQTISFDIPAGECDGAGVCTVRLTEALPLINGPVTIDGATQPGSVCGSGPTAVKVFIDGSALGTGNAGLAFIGISRGSVLRGLAVGGFGSSPDLRLRPGVGIDLSDGERFSEPGGQHRLECVYAGTDAIGAAARPNGVGLQIYSDSTVVGAPGRGVLVSANMRAGIEISGRGVVVQASRVGTDASGTRPLGNAGDGVRLTRGGDDLFGTLRRGRARIGGAARGEGNTIAFNAGAGIFHDGESSFSSSGPGSPFLGNALFENGGPGIDLAPAGATPNDGINPTCTSGCRADSDSGPNRLMNTPVIASSGATGGGIVVGYRVPTHPLEAAFPLRVEFFAADAAGQGRTYVGFDTYTEADLNASGDKTATVPFSGAAGYEDLIGGPRLVATATDALGNTSEFSAVPVTIPNEAASDLPIDFALEAPRPNPARGAATLRYALPAAGTVRVEAFDLLGRRVAVLVDGARPAGWHEARLDASRLGAGVYVVRMTAGTFSAAQRVTVVR